MKSQNTKYINEAMSIVLLSKHCSEIEKITVYFYKSDKKNSFLVISLFSSIVVHFCKSIESLPFSQLVKKISYTYKNESHINVKHLF